MIKSKARRIILKINKEIRKIQNKQRTINKMIQKVNMYKAKIYKIKRKETIL